MTTTPAPSPSTIPDLIEAWREAMADVRAVVDDLGESRWRDPSLLPGWSVADIVAHLSWIERILLGLGDPPHEPDWSALPHVGSEFSRATEIPVDLRRGWDRDRVLAEFDTTMADRHAALLAGPRDPASPAVNPFGRLVTLDVVLRMRTFDTWVHSQDIRLAVGQPGATTGAAARVSAERVAAGLGYVWAKRVDAPIGATLRIDVGPPGICLTHAISRAPDGNGVPVTAPEHPTVHLQMPFDDFIQLGCGRTRPDSTPAQARARIHVSGDRSLAAQTIAELNIAP